MIVASDHTELETIPWANSLQPAKLGLPECDSYAASAVVHDKGSGKDSLMNAQPVGAWECVW